MYIVLPLMLLLPDDVPLRKWIFEMERLWPECAS